MTLADKFTSDLSPLSLRDFNLILGMLEDPASQIQKLATLEFDPESGNWVFVFIFTDGSSVLYRIFDSSYRSTVFGSNIECENFLSQNYQDLQDRYLELTL